MRKLLLGSTAVAAAALFAPGGAMAQGNDPFQTGLGAPSASLRGLEVRIGGYYRAFYSYADQNGDSANGAGINGSTAGANGRLGKSDFSNEIEIHILASGKAANGLRYGVALEIENDSVRQGSVVVTQTGAAPNNTVVATNGPVSKNTINYDEAWAYLAGPWGQVRFGDEDGALAQLQSGHITGFGVGGLDSGDVNQQIVGANLRATFNTVNDPGDNTKVIYLTPQFLGFDAGASFAFNSGEGALSGCDSLSTLNLCDRTGARNAVDVRRRNELQAALRWRGSFGPVGLSATVGYIGADSIKNTAGVSPSRMDMVWAGVVGTAYGFSLGGWYTGGTGNSNGGNFQTRLPSRAGIGNAVDDRNQDSFLIGATYTIDAITVGGHYAQTVSAGNQAITTGARRATGYSVGGNYRIAPGLDLFAEYNQIQIKERNVNLITGAVGGGTAGTDFGLVLAGFRVAF